MPFPRAVPAAVRQTMQNAFEDLEKVITPQDSKDYHDCSLERVRQETLNIENQLGSRGWLCNMRRLKPLFAGLEHYSKVVDTLCNGTPFLPWIWAPITLILRIASEHIESFDSLIGAYGRIGSSLQRFEILRKSFLGDPRFHETAAAFYADILEFHKHAYKFVRRSGWKLLFSTSWGRFQRRFGNILEDLKRHEDLIDRLVNAIDIAEARQLRQELSSWREQSLQQISLEDKEQSAKEFQAIQSWLRVNECDQLSIFESAAAPGNRFPGTCGWILNNAKIRSWLQKSPQSSILWLSGVAGSGKSVISSQLINFIRSQSDTVLYHFCTNLSITSSEYEQVLKSLLEQLLRQDADLAANVYNSYVLTKKVASVPILEQLLLSLLVTSAEDPNRHSYIWVVLDGVDELRDHSPNSQARLLNFVKQIVTKTAASENITCKAFISCRPTKTSSHILRQKPTVSLTDEKKSLGSAIQEYALQRLRSLDTRFQQLGFTALEIENIGQQISVKSDGMFLYARLVLDFVSSNIFVRGDELRNSINQLPRELSAFYLQLLSQILAPLDENSKRHIECIFGWVAYAKRPLRRSELLSAVGFSSGDPDTKFPAPQYILDVCRTLIEERRDTTLTFIHVSVKEFLQSSSSGIKISEEAAVNQQCIASIACLLSSMKLLNQDRQQAFQVLVRGVYGLQIYATVYWTEYLLSIVDRNGGLDRRSTLYNLLCQLSEGVDTAFEDGFQEPYSDDRCDDKRLDKLKEHQGIYRNVRKAILARSLKQLEQRLRIESSSEATKQRSVPVTEDGISALLPQYQKLLLNTMNEMDIPGVSSRDLEAFRNEFTTSIHTCRLRACPRATVGFETKDLRVEHERSHVQRYPCTRMGCQYPPFLTPESLKAHVRREHDTATPPKSIRRVKTIAASHLILNERQRATLQKHQTELMRQELRNSLIAARLMENTHDDSSSGVLAEPSSVEAPLRIPLPSSVDPSPPVVRKTSPAPRQSVEEVADFQLYYGNTLPSMEQQVEFSNTFYDQRSFNLHSAFNPSFSTPIGPIPDAPSRESPPPALPPPRFVTPDGPSANHNEFFEQQIIKLPRILSRPDEDELPDTVSGHGSGEPGADITDTSPFNPSYQRVISQSGQPPAAPTSPQPPFPPQPGGSATSQQAPQPQQSQRAQHSQRTEQPGSNQAPTPLNEANLAKQMQALNKAHQRSNGKSGQPPAAPTSTQPRFQLGAASPDGKPTWVAETPLTQEKLHLPNARTEMKRANDKVMQDQHTQMLAQQIKLIQQMPQAAPTMASAYPQQARQGSALEQPKYDTYGHHPFTTGGVSQDSIPPYPPTRQSLPQLLHVNATDRPVNAFQRELPEPVVKVTPSNANTATSYWSVAEMNNFPELLRSFGMDWQAIAKHMTNKTATMVKSFFDKQITHEKPEWVQIVADANGKMLRGEKLPLPPTPTAGPRNRRSDFGTHRYVP